MMEEIEIPEAIRENSESSPKSSRFPMPLLATGIVLLGATGLVLVRLFLPWGKSIQTNEIVPNNEPIAPTETDTVQQPQSEQATPTQTETVPQTTQTDLLGHLPYDVAPESELTPVTADGRLKMRPAAATKLKQMQTDAQADGITLTILSAFRDLEIQDQLFFRIKEQRLQDAAKRAEVSAPPGYSEHHTGYAVDLGDANAPATNLEVTFADTAAFRWLEENASKYSFELSFPQDNKQGISYEPWHWRFVGDRDSLETFYQVDN